MAQLSEPASDKPFFTDGINKKDILQHYELNKARHVRTVLIVHFAPACFCCQGFFSLWTQAKVSYLFSPCSTCHVSQWVNQTGKVLLNHVTAKSSAPMYYLTADWVLILSGTAMYSYSKRSLA